VQISITLHLCPSRVTLHNSAIELYNMRPVMFDKMRLLGGAQQRTPLQE